MRSLAERALRAAAWTGMLAAGLFAADRLFLGPRPEPGWYRVQGPEAIPAAAGEMIVPAYLPSCLAWPPAQVWVRTAAPPGWWVWSPSRDRPGEGLWIGTATGPPPVALGDLAACVTASTGEACPSGWQGLSTAVRDGRTIFLVARLEPAELARFVEGLRLAGD